MLGLGIQPDILLCRSDRHIPIDLKKKIAMFCNVADACVISMEDVDTIYAVPVELNREGLDLEILRLLHLEAHPQNFGPWLELVDRLHNPQGEVRIAVVGKYVQLEDAYKSLREALLHGGLAHQYKTVLEWIEAEEIHSTEEAAERLRGYDGILVPGGFGKRGIQGNGPHHSVRSRTPRPLLRNLPGHAVRHHRVRPRRRAPAGCGQHRVRSANSSPRNL